MDGGAASRVGGAGNAAVAGAALGARTRLAAVVGDDPRRHLTRMHDT
ncbi:hypothetical protein FRACA_1710015 [Frankia canadensis]|uniref:Uncharacterized protein n=1 Tax=Frankia canadensis TaxID=1836972 RepID=A0A2I2KNC4_9ACTN|nr:hypothetical protein FRACA_1710015 [Frankia canadensis]SOU54432.1 hypothetical protein FRACA_1710015 [Frankia canadensis]